jgi:hypothetical protein
MKKTGFDELVPDRAAAESYPRAPEVVVSLSTKDFSREQVAQLAKLLETRLERHVSAPTLEKPLPACYTPHGLSQAVISLQEFTCSSEPPQVQSAKKFWKRLRQKSLRH